MTDTTITVCDDTRRALVKRIAAQYPALEWVATPFLTPEITAALTPEQIAALRGEAVVLASPELLWSLPAGASEKPGQVETETLYCTIDILNVRTDAGSTDPKTVIRQLHKGDSILVEKPRILVGGNTWVKFAGEVAFACEIYGKANEYYLSPR